MPITPHTTLRLSDETRAAIEELGRIWGPVSPLTKTEVVGQAVRRCLDMERRRAKVKSRPAKAGEG